jgi:transaldolase/glucose-6-phosphate isomerase
MSFRLAIPPDLRGAVGAAAADWQANNKIERFWKKDPSLWTRDGEEKWMGWIDIVERQQKDLSAMAELGGDVRSAGFESALLLGMGGSSLCPEVLAKTFGPQPGFPALHIVDSTDPAEVLAASESVDLGKALVIVASKSGTTLEPNILKQFFYEQVRRVVGAENVGSHFVAITDPGSKMEQVAKQDNFRYIFYGDPTIGGRYSALSNFGVVAATVAGLKVGKMLDEAAKGVASAKEPVQNNPGVQLGLLLGTAANAGRDKLTFFTSPEIYDLGAWLEQLIAESTGKQGKGLIPIDLEPLGSPAVYGSDRVFAYVRLEHHDDPARDTTVRALEEAGQPVARITLASKEMIFQEFFRWEVAIAVAGAVIGIDPFDQPDVEASKIKTRALTAAYERTGELPADRPILSEGGLSVYADAANSADLGKADNLEELLRAHLQRAGEGDYFALLAYLDRNPAHAELLQDVRRQVRDHRKVATVMEFGPRFLHSTGQAYKGGPNSGVFLQITGNGAPETPIPGRKASFGIVEAAEARGDYEVLAERKRRLVRIDLGDDVESGLHHLAKAVERALA